MESCKHGHERTQANTYQHPGGFRVCRPCITASSRKWTANHTATNRLKAKRWGDANPDRKNARVKALKAEVLGRYSNRPSPCCSWPDCDVSDLDVLSLDHVRDDGALHRKSIASGSSLYAHLRKAGFPAGYQTLCMNHQWKKEMLRKAEALRLKRESYLEAIEP